MATNEQGGRKKLTSKKQKETSKIEQICGRQRCKPAYHSSADTASRKKFTVTFLLWLHFYCLEYLGGSLLTILLWLWLMGRSQREMPGCHSFPTAVSRGAFYSVSSLIVFLDRVCRAQDTVQVHTFEYLKRHSKERYLQKA